MNDSKLLKLTTWFVIILALALSTVMCFYAYNNIKPIKNKLEYCQENGYEGLYNVADIEEGYFACYKSQYVNHRLVNNSIDIFNYDNLFWKDNKYKKRYQSNTSKWR